MWQDLQIIHYPDPRLRTKSKPIPDVNQDIRDLAKRMFELMREQKGVGLAAPQVGINLQLFVMNHDGNPENDRVVLNPVIEFIEGSITEEEGCLSLPEIRIDVIRSDVVRLTGLDENGTPIDRTDAGFAARIWQHEFDHLQGVMLTDRMSMLDKLRYRKALGELKATWDKANDKPGAKKLLPIRKR